MGQTLQEPAFFPAPVKCRKRGAQHRKSRTLHEDKGNRDSIRWKLWWCKPVKCDSIRVRGLRVFSNVCLLCYSPILYSSAYLLSNLPIMLELYACGDYCVLIVSRN